MLIAAGISSYFALRNHNSGPATFTASGTFVLAGIATTEVDPDDGNYTNFGGTCAGANGYDDIDSGAQVTVADEAGKTLAVADLGNGQVTDEGCSFPINIPKVPTGHKLYDVTVSHRGGIHYTQAQMRGNIALSLGP